MTTNNAKGGEFATARRGGVDASELAFIADKRAKGVSDFAIAQMIGRPVLSVQAVAKLSDLAPQPQPQPAAAAVAPAPVVKPVLVGPKPRPRKPEPQSMPIRVRQAVEALAEWHDVTLEDLIGPRQTRELAHVRQEAFWMLRTKFLTVDAQPRFPLKLIGSWFGGRDHSTVSFGVERHAGRIKPQRVAA